MKMRITAVTCALALGAALSQPHQAGGQDTKPVAPVTLADMKTELISLQKRIAGTIESLEQAKACRRNDGALAKAIAEFRTRFNALETQVGTLQTQAVVAKARAREQYEVWQKDLASVQNPGIREKAQDRFAESKKEFDRIIEKAQAAKEQALPFVSELKDIAIYFEADPSELAVQSLSNTIWKVGYRSKSVIGSLKKVIEQIDRTLMSQPKK
jgi:cell division protein FtsB